MNNNNNSLILIYCYFKVFTPLNQQNSPYNLFLLLFTHYTKKKKKLQNDNSLSFQIFLEERYPHTTMTLTSQLIPEEQTPNSTNLRLCNI